MSNLTINNGYRVTQHEDSKEVLIFRDKRLVLRASASRQLSDAELLDVFNFYKNHTNELEEKHDDEKDS